MTAMMMNASVYIIEVCFFLLLTFLGITLPAAAAQALKCRTEEQRNHRTSSGALAFCCRRHCITVGRNRKYHDHNRRHFPHILTAFHHQRYLLEKQQA